MKKRIICLILCILTVFPMVLTGCSNASGTAATTTTSATATSTATKNAKTVTLYSITEKSTTPEAIAAVEEKLNTICEPLLNLHVVLKLYTEDEYEDIIYKKIEAQIAEKELDAQKLNAKKIALRAAKEAGFSTTAVTTSPEETAPETDKTVLNEYGFEETVYPEAKENQLDILLVNSYDQLIKFQKDGVIASIQSEITGASKLLSDYINPNLMNNIKIEKSLYAVPNNHVIGNYQFLLLNRELVDKYFFNPNDYQSYQSLDSFLEYISQKEPSYIPLMSEAEPYIEYVNGTPSLIGSFVNKTAPGSSLSAPTNLLGVAAYTQHLEYTKKYTEKGYLDTKIDMSKKFAAAIVNGNYTMLDEYKDDYYVSVYKYPRITNDEVYGPMYAVSSYSPDLSRCMELISLFTTNKDFRNIFQYGVEGVHYEVDEETGVYNILNKDYSMNMYYTGNQFILHPSNEMSPEMLKLAEDNWAAAKEQNLAALTSPYLNFTLKENEADAAVEGYISVEETFSHIVKTSEEYLKKLSEFKEYTDDEGNLVTFEAYVQILKAELDADMYFLIALNTEDAYSIASQYTTWYDKNFNG